MSTDSITISTAKALCVAVVLKFALERVTLLRDKSDVVHFDVSVLPDDHLPYVLLYGSNVYNSVANRLINSETIAFIRNTECFICLEAFQ